MRKVFENFPARKYVANSSSCRDSHKRPFLRSATYEHRACKPGKVDALPASKGQGYNPLMSKKLLLVDYENVHKIDLSLLDESYSAIIFVGAKQNPPKAAVRSSTAYRFQRVDFQKIEGSGKNALDFHIAYHLGRVVETSPETECIVLSKDKGFDPLLAHINKAGFTCSRADRLEDLVGTKRSAPTEMTAVACPRCRRSSTIPHHGGEWCTNCGCFASPPDQEQLPSNQMHQSARLSALGNSARQLAASGTDGAKHACGWCSYQGDMGDGIYDDGEWMCGGCVAGFVNDQLP